MNDRKLLLVDDEPMLLELLKEEFEDLGIHCFTAENGFKALDIIKRENLDAILCDINMPGMDGLDLLIEMRRLQFETPLVFLTGHGEKDHAIRALRNGAFDFINKPYDRTQLIETVTQALALGVELRSFEKELDELCAKVDPVSPQLQQYREIQKFFLKNKKHIKVLNKRVG